MVACIHCKCFEETTQITILSEFYHISRKTNFRKQPIIAIYFKSENKLKFYNLESSCAWQYIFCNAELRKAFLMFEKGGKNKMAARDLGELLRCLGWNPSERELEEARHELVVSGK